MPLVLVHRRQLLEQWVARLQAFLDIPANDIGVIYGGKKNSRPASSTSRLCRAWFGRALCRISSPGDYGHVVFDECHHLSAVGFEAIAQQTKARFVLGLSATVTRKDGHHPIIFMQCGPGSSSGRCQDTGNRAAL